MSDDDNWHWWQTYAATGGIAAAAIVFGKYYTEEKERAEAKTALLLTASNKLKDSTVIITGANTGVGKHPFTCYCHGLLIGDQVMRRRPCSRKAVPRSSLLVATPPRE